MSADKKGDLNCRHKCGRGIGFTRSTTRRRRDAPRLRFCGWSSRWNSAERNDDEVSVGIAVSGVVSDPYPHIAGDVLRSLREECLLLIRERPAVVHLQPARHVGIAFYHRVEVDGDIVSSRTCLLPKVRPTEEDDLLPSPQVSVPHIDDLTLDDDIALIQNLVTGLRRQDVIVLLGVTAAREQEDDDDQFRGQ